MSICNICHSYSNILSDILSGIYFDILSDILSGVYSDILSGIYSGILSFYLASILILDTFWHSICHSLLRVAEGSAHWDLELAAEELEDEENEKEKEEKEEDGMHLR